MRLLTAKTPPKFLGRIFGDGSIIDYICFIEKITEILLRDEKNY